MDLTDEQWALLQPLIPSASPAAASPKPCPEPYPEDNPRINRRCGEAPGRGRPPLDERQVLNGILWKFRTRSPWYDMPSGYPSHQTCYRRYRQWRRLGVLTTIYRCLYLDLRRRGGLDLQAAFQDGTLRLQIDGRALNLLIDPLLQNTWQHATALLLLAWAPRIMRTHPNPPPSTPSESHGWISLHT